MRRNQGLLRRSVVLGVAMAVVVGAAFALHAGASDSSIARGFQAGDDEVVPGAIVSLESGTASTVELATLKNRGSLVGVVSAEALLEFVNGEPIQVITGGATATLVSDLNGDIKAGDRITTSPIFGVGMKATESVVVAGTAQNDFDATKAKARTITAKDGKKSTVHIGTVSVLVSPGFFQLEDGQNALVPSAFQNLANNVAGRSVSAVRVLVVGLIILLMLTVVAVLVYSSVRSSIISIGRNPLSKSAVHKSLYQVGVTAFGVLAFTVIVVYLILTT